MRISCLDPCSSVKSPGLDADPVLHSISSSSGTAWHPEPAYELWEIHTQMLRILENCTQISPGFMNEELTTTTSTVHGSHLLQQWISFLPIGASGSRHTSLSLLLSVTLKNTRDHTPLDAPSVCAQACSAQPLTWQWLCCRWGFCGRLWGLSVVLWRHVGSGDRDTSPGQRCRPTAWLQTSRNRITVRLRQFSEQTEISWAWMFT